MIPLFIGVVGLPALLLAGEQIVQRYRRAARNIDQQLALVIKERK